MADAGHVGCWCETPVQGSINKYVGQHPLRDRARKLDQGILIIRCVRLCFRVCSDTCGRSR